MVDLESLDPFFAGYEHLTHDERLNRIREYIRPFADKMENFAKEQREIVADAGGGRIALSDEEKNLVAQAIIKLKLGLPVSAVEDMRLDAVCSIDRECLNAFDNYLHAINISGEEFLAMEYVPPGTTINMVTGKITVPWYYHPEPLEDD